MTNDDLRRLLADIGTARDDDMLRDAIWQARLKAPYAEHIVELLADAVRETQEFLHEQENAEPAVMPPANSETTKVKYGK